MTTSARETALAGLFTLLGTALADRSPPPTLLRNETTPQRLPPGGLVVLLDGDTLEAEPVLGMQGETSPQEGRRGSVRDGLVATAQQQAGDDQGTRLAALRAERFRLALEVEAAETDAAARGINEREQAAQRAAEARRQRAVTEVTELRTRLDDEFRIRQQFAERTRSLDAAVQAGAIDTTERDRLLAMAARDRDEALRRAAGSSPGRSGGGDATREDRSIERLDQRLAALRAATAGEREQAEAVAGGARAVQDAETRQKAYTEALRFGVEGTASFDAALARLLVAHRNLATAQAEGRAATLAFTDAQTRADLALRQSLIGATAVERARATAAAQRTRELTNLGVDPKGTRGRSLVAAAADLAENRLAVERSEAAFTEIGRIGEQAFDRIGSAITQMAMEGRLSMRSLGDVGQAVASELSQAFIPLALLNPLKNMLGGGNAPTLGDFLPRIVSGLGGFFAPSLPVAPPVYGGLYHTGGVVGAGAPGGWRAVPEEVFRGAPRFHRGGMIGADEVPIIAQRGEGVFTPAQMRALGPADGSTTINVTFQGGDLGREADRAAMVEQMRAVIRQEIDGRTPGIIRAAHGYSVAQVQRGGASAREFGRR